MREILFRGKRIDNGEWVYGNSFIPDFVTADTQICIGTPRIRITYNVIPETIGQYTGLTDKNGKKIFEGDIVESVFTKKPYIVLFGEYTYTNDWGDTEILCGWYNEDEDGYVTSFGCSDKWAIVIGNIHDNPELLKGE